MNIEKGVREALKPHDEVLSAYLYGSIAKGTDYEDSDVDIGLLLSDDFSPDALYTSRVSEEIEEILGSDRTVDVRTLNDKPIIFQHQVLKNGLNIFTRDEKARIDFETEAYKKYLDYKPFFERFNEIRRKRILA